MSLQHKMMCDSNTFDVIIIGAGPSSFAACIYLSNAGYKVAYIEKNIPGGKLVNIPFINNYPGYKQISGADLALNMYEQAQKAGAISLFGEVSQIDQYLNYHVVYTTDGAIRYCKSLRRLRCEREISVRIIFQIRGVYGLLRRDIRFGTRRMFFAGTA